MGLSGRLFCLRGSLLQRLEQTLYEETLKLAPNLRTGDMTAVPQDHSLATSNPKRSPEDGEIEWSDSTDYVYRLIHAAGRPYPGAFSWCNHVKFTIWRAHPCTDGSVRSERAGKVLVNGDEGIRIATGDGSIWLDEVAPRGSNGDVRALLRPGVVLGR